MVLLRLQGCDVGCPFCDTKETWYLREGDRKDSIQKALGTNELYAEVTADEVVGYVASMAGRIRWVMITGGEPARYDLRELVTGLHQAGFKTAVETSGTYPLQCEPTWLCVSPKVDMPGKRQIDGSTVAKADELKFVIGKQSDFDTVDSLLNEYRVKPGAQVSLQPMSLSRKATDLCLETALERGWRLSLQTHKLIEIE
jgi:7-carboxy-7-deazaguanine synthase